MSLATLVAAAVSAEDLRFAVPEGQRVEDMVSVRNGRVAYGLADQWDADGRTLRTTIVQRAGAREVRTPFEGKAVPVEISPDGERVLVWQNPLNVGVCCGCSGRSHLLDSDGRIVWSSEELASYWFSPTGEAIYAELPCPEENCAGSRLDVRDRDGRPVQVVEPGFYVRWALALGKGEELIVLQDETLWRLRSSHGLGFIWRVDLDRAEDIVVGGGPITCVLEDKFVVRQGSGRFVVVSFDGEIVYTYDAEALGARDPEHGLDEYRWLEPEAGPDSATLWLARRDGDLLLDLASGRMTRFTVDRTMPAGFYELESVRNGHLIWSGGDVVLRPVRFPAVTAFSTAGDPQPAANP